MSWAIPLKAAEKMLGVRAKVARVSGQSVLLDVRAREASGWWVPFTALKKITNGAKK